MPEQIIYPEEHKINTVNRVARVARCEGCESYGFYACSENSPCYPDEAYICPWFKFAE